LHASGTKVVDVMGNPVLLKGVNLGGWMFVETWIPDTDYTTAGRAVAVGEGMGIREQVIAAARVVGMQIGDTENDAPLCPGKGPEWIEAFRVELEKTAGAEKTGLLVAELVKYPTLCEDADYKLRKLLEKRFGIKGRDELLDIFQRAWITESDISWLAAQGMNVVRVPISYRDITAMEDVDLPESLVWNGKALERIDDLLGWCEKNGVYAVIDMQEVPGGQNSYGDRPAYLWTNEHMKELTVELWEYLSDRYRGRDVVAFYSLMAEPFGAPDTKARDEMYDRIVKAIRARGDDHLLVIHDGFFGMNTLPLPSDYGWTGVVYSTHIFEDADTLDMYKFYVEMVYEKLFTDAQKEQKVPYYIGSFSTKSAAEWAYESAQYLVNWYEKHRWSWSLWTYKLVLDPLMAEVFGYDTAWGLRSRLNTPFDRPDVYLDDYETLSKKFAAYKGLELGANEGLLKALTAGAAGGVAGGR